VREIRGCNVGVVCIVHSKEIDDKLSDLHCGKMFFPPYPTTTSSRIIIVIHKHMDSEVEGDWDP